MKSLSSLVICLLVVVVVAVVQGIPAPDDYKLSCWDVTFAYNRVKIEVADGQLTWTLTGQNLNVFRALLNLSSDYYWGNCEVMFSFDITQCNSSSENPQLLTCGDYNQDLTISASVSQFGQPDLKWKSVLKNGSAQVRIVESVLRSVDPLFKLLQVVINAPGNGLSSNPPYTQAFPRC